MGDGVDFPEGERNEQTVITDGFFEREVYLSSRETAAFLRDVADAVETDDELRVSGDDWEIPFQYRDPIEVEVEFTSRNERELEIELEFSEPRGTGNLDVG
jgi:amphi-Trp domain-containing protein